MQPSVRISLIGLALAATLVLSAGAAQAQTLAFAGYDWLVRSYGGGPGPNEWRAENVFVDAEGLHLEISQVDGMWSAAEVVMTTSLGFGTYGFEVAGPLATLDRNVALGLFNYPPSEAVGPNGTNEIDIEFSQWGAADNPNRLNWSVYPPALGPKPTHKEGRLKLRGEISTHRFVWSAKGVRFASFDGAGEGGKPFAEWNDAPKKPATRIPQVPLPVHINLWLLDGKPPSDGQPVEVVIRNFEFVPENEN